MKELKVGERITLEVVESPLCTGCYFADAAKGNCPSGCCSYERPDGKGVIFKEIKKQKRNMKENKHSLKISRSLFGDITLDGYPTATYSIDELKILKNLLTQVLGEVDEYMSLKDKGACV